MNYTEAKLSPYNEENRMTSIHLDTVNKSNRKTFNFEEEHLYLNKVD